MFKDLKRKSKIGDLHHRELSQTLDAPTVHTHRTLATPAYCICPHPHFQSVFNMVGFGKNRTKQKQSL